MHSKLKITISLFLLLNTLQADEAKSLFKSKCMFCHTTQSVVDKSKLLGPPADEVMLHVKEAYSNKKEAVAFMVDYILKPEVSKALCASMDKFGLMPSMKSSVSKEEAKTISELMYEKFPRASFQVKETKSRANIKLKDLDENSDGKISAKEFRNFRAKRNNIDPASLKHDLYFQKVDLNGNGYIDKKEFNEMKDKKR